MLTSFLSPSLPHTKKSLQNNADCTLLDVDGNFAYDNAEEEEIRALLLKHMMFNGEPSYMYVIAVTLASFPGPRWQGEKGLVFTVCDVLKSGGIPPAPWMFDYVCTLVTSADYVIHTVITS